MDRYFLLIFTGFALSGCAGGGTGPGYLFYVVFLIIPLYWIGYSLFKKTEDNTDSLYVIEGQLKRLGERIEKIEENTKKTTKTRKSRTKKSTTDK